MDERSLRNLASLPPIRRARGWRLYAESGARFLDLWQDEGRGILGAKGTGVGTVAKAFMDRGLAAPLPGVIERRLVEALKREWQGWSSVRVFADEAEARKALLLAGFGRERDPAREALAAFRAGAASGAGNADSSREGVGDCQGGKDFVILRSFSDSLGADFPGAADRPDGCRAALVRLPCPRALSPAICLFRSEADAPAGHALPAPAVLLASAAKALAELEGLRRIATEESWRRADRRLRGLFERRGPWLFPRAGAADYDRLFGAALARGVLLSPDSLMPSILPPEFDDGELKALSELSL